MPLKNSRPIIEGRIAILKDRLASAQIIDVSQIRSDTITFGAYVVLSSEDVGKKVTYQIVGEDEADAKQGKLSIQAPLTKKLIGCKKGDVFELHTPKGKKNTRLWTFTLKSQL